MSLPEVIVIFDIGKTYKKVLIFDRALCLLYQHEEQLSTTFDEDGCECDDIEKIEAWIKSSLSNILASGLYDVRIINFCTYGATLVFLDKEKKRLKPVYNYLKEVPRSIQDSLFNRYGGEEEFCRKTASPALGRLLNSGVQILWFRQQFPECFNELGDILHFPQYLSYLFTGQIVSESTSIGCHTFLWDFDKNEYHRWLKDIGISLPEPKKNNFVVKTEINGRSVLTGIGIHDSSASLALYILNSKKKFILVSTGTWCVNMNPFNHDPLSPEQLKRDCLTYLSIDQKPVKSSRLFLGHLHDIHVRRISAWFNVGFEEFKKVDPDINLIRNLLNEGTRGRMFFRNGIPQNYTDESVVLSQFRDYPEAYHQLMYDLCQLNAESIRLIISPEDTIQYLHVSGGFSRNPIFMHLIASLFPGKEVFTSEIDNSSAMGAAMVLWEHMGTGSYPEIELNSKKWPPVI
jgi:sugar (pentulose or hexulose) kinase